jgi:outer membrane protein OmpA-like peptidoglycan-associated protein
MIMIVRASLAMFAVVAVVAPSAVAAADPLSFKLAGDVPAGKKPALSITANEPVSKLVLDVERDDGKHFKSEHPSLAKGATATLPIGDGAAGKASYKGTLSAQVAGGKRWTEELTFTTVVRGGPLKVTYDAEHLDLDKHVLQFKLSRPAASAELTVIGDDGSEIAKAQTQFKTDTGDWLAISWTQPDKARVMKLQLRVVASDGQATNVELVPWSVNVDHEDVNFSTDSAKIEASETAKLDASLARIQEVVKRSEKFVPMRLYIAGHTDTVGPNAKNRKLSLERALAIGAYFKKKGLAIPVVVAGFGEEVLRVKTGDNTDERANRRADYVLGPAAGAPPFKGPYLKVRAAWKQLK